LPFNRAERPTAKQVAELQYSRCAVSVSGVQRPRASADGRNAASVTVSVDEIDVADPADAWTRAGFSVDTDARCQVGGVGIRLVGRDRGTGIVGWSLRGLPPDASVDELDGIPTKRSGEVVGSPEPTGEGPSTLWGITYVVADIDVTAAFFGDHTTPVKDAVQPRRRITTLRHHELELSVRTAMISAPIRDR
jgi:hypothetical protein